MQITRHISVHCLSNAVNLKLVSRSFIALFFFSKDIISKYKLIMFNESQRAKKCPVCRRKVSGCSFKRKLVYERSRCLESVNELLHPPVNLTISFIGLSKVWKWCLATIHKGVMDFPWQRAQYWFVIVIRNLWKGRRAFRSLMFLSSDKRKSLYQEAS